MIPVRTEQCWNGAGWFFFRLTLPDGQRERITGSKWTRASSQEALDLLTSVYGLERRKIRFVHN